MIIPLIISTARYGVSMSKEQASMALLVTVVLTAWIMYWIIKYIECEISGTKTFIYSFILPMILLGVFMFIS